MKRGTLGAFVIGGLLVAALVLGGSVWVSAVIVVALILVYLAVSDLHSAFEDSRLPTEPMKKCPHCAEIVKVAARVCRYCGREV